MSVNDTAVHIWRKRTHRNVLLSWSENTAFTADSRELLVFQDWRSCSRIPLAVSWVIATKNRADRWMERCYDGAARKVVMETQEKWQKMSRDYKNRKILRMGDGKMTPRAKALAVQTSWPEFNPQSSHGKLDYVLSISNPRQRDCSEACKPVS